MLSYTKLAGNARRFKTLMGMSLQEFNLLLAKVEKAHPETERLSKRPRGRATACCSSCSTTGRTPPKT